MVHPRALEDDLLANSGNHLSRERDESVILVLQPTG
jgi:hypothetical protein